MEVFLVLLNFFFLDRDVEKCARYHGDKHLNKMQLEYAQIASTVMWIIQKKHNFTDFSEKIYKPTHKGHPVVVWASKSTAHVLWIINLGIQLAKEKIIRAERAKEHGKKWSIVHKSTPILHYIKTNLYEPEYFEMRDEWIDPPACMPECVKRSNVIDSYRLYYAGPKVQLINLKWLPYVEEPPFLQEFKEIAESSKEIQEYIKTQQ